MNLTNKTSVQNEYTLQTSKSVKTECQARNNQLIELCVTQYSKIAAAEIVFQIMFLK